MKRCHPVTGFSPESEGAQCDHCILGPGSRFFHKDRVWSPVQDEIRPGASTVVVMSNPADDESRVGLPAQGKAGVEMTMELEAAGMPRHSRRVPKELLERMRSGELTTDQLRVVYGGVSVANVIKCQPFGTATGAYARMTAKWRELNRAAAKSGKGQFMHPAEACWPLLAKTLAKHDNVIALGGEALKVITGTSMAITARKGSIGRIKLSDSAYPAAPIIGEDEAIKKRKFAATYNPSHVMQAPGERDGVVADLSKFRRFFTDKLRWNEPGILFNPTVDVALAFLERLSHEPRFFHDWETNAKEPLVAITRCGGFGYPHAKRRIECWACNDRHNGNHQKESFLDQLRSLKNIGSGCPICDGSGFHETDFTILLLTFTSVSPRASTDGVFYSVDEYRRLVAGVNELFKACRNTTKSGDAPMGIGHNCLYSGTPVILADGTSEPVDALVRRKYAGGVKALDVNGNIVNADVIGWYRGRVDNQPWLTIRRVGEKGGARGLTVTPDHEVYTTRGRLRADALIVGDEILTEERLLQPHETAALLGTMLGDSSVSSRSTRSVDGKVVAVTIPLGETATAALSGAHVGTAHSEDKARWLNGLLALKTDTRTGGFSGGNEMTTIRTTKLRQVANLARLVYNDDWSRKVTVEALEALGPIGLAWWFGDDGFKHTRPGKRENVLLAVCRYDDAAVATVLEWCEQKFGPVSQTQNRCIRFTVEATQAFVEHIAPYLLPSQRYKLPADREWPEFVGFPPVPEQRPLPVRIESIEVYEPPRTDSRLRGIADTQWCLQTTNGNFLTGFGFVSNCNVYDKQTIEASPWRPAHFYAIDNKGESPKVVPFSFDIEIGYAEDTMLDARYVSPESRKGLAVLGARFEDISVWKEDHEGNKTAVGTKNDWELGVYCCNDIAVDGRVYPKARAIAVEHGSHNDLRHGDVRQGPDGGQVVVHPANPELADMLGFDKPYDVDVAAMRRHVGMHRVGVHVNQERRVFFQRILDSQAAWHLDQFNAIAGTKIDMDAIRTEEDEQLEDGVAAVLAAHEGDASSFITGINETGINVNSGNQLRDLIYGKWGIEKPAILDDVEFYTKTGAQGCGDHVLRAICVDERTPRKVTEALHHLRMAKRKRWKLSKTTLGPLGRGTPEINWALYGAESGWSEAWEAGIRPATGKEKGFIWPDGVVRPSWSSRTAVFRDDCSEPNMMNIGSRKGGLRVTPFSNEVYAEMKRRKRLIEKAIKDGASDEQLMERFGRTSWAYDTQEQDRLAAMFPGTALFDHTWTMLARAYDSADAPTQDAAYMYIAALVARHLDHKEGILKGKMKSIFDAKPGMALIGGDMDQLHLRIIANLYKIPILLEAFEKGLDPHNALAYAVFGDAFKNATGWGPDGFSLKRKPLGGDALQMREAMKTFRYAVIYGASPDTAWRVYVAVENDVGGLPFSGNWVNTTVNGKVERKWTPLRKTEIRSYHERWRKAEPEWETNFWKPCQEAYSRNAAALAASRGSFGGSTSIHVGAVGFLIDPLLGTRSGALEGGSPSATSNWTVLRTEAVIMRIVERAMMEAYPYGSSRATRRASEVRHWARFGNPWAGDIWDLGLNSQVHDWVCAQIVDQSDGAENIAKSDWGKRELQRCSGLMNVRLPGHSVVYSCEPGIGRGMHEV